MNPENVIALINLVGVAVLAGRGLLEEWRKVQESKRETMKLSSSLGLEEATTKGDFVIKAMNALSEQITSGSNRNEHLQGRITELDKRISDTTNLLQNEIQKTNRLRGVIDGVLEINWHLVQGVEILSKQIDGLGHTPVWTMPHYLMVRMRRYRDHQLGLDLFFPDVEEGKEKEGEEGKDAS